MGCLGRQGRERSEKGRREREGEAGREGGGRLGRRGGGGVRKEVKKKKRPHGRRYKKKERKGDRQADRRHTAEVQGEGRAGRIGRQMLKKGRDRERRVGKNGEMCRDLTGRLARAAALGRQAVPRSGFVTAQLGP